MTDYPLDDPQRFRFASRAVHAGQPHDPLTGALMPPIYQNSTYAQPAPAEPINGYEYSRTKNPTRVALERNMASLEGARFGLAFASGMSAINTIMQTFPSGSHVVASDDTYGGTYRLFEHLYRGYGFTFTYVNMSNLDEIRAAVRPETKLIFCETPTNPMLRLCDLAGVAEIARAAGAVSVCDNTFATPYLQQPIELGIDVVVHSATKYLGGHSDVVGGVVCTSNEGIQERLAFFQNGAGAVPGPMDCFLVLRGTKTLHLRMDRHCASAQVLAQYLEEHPKVSKVYYPGLPSHPDHELAARQMSGFGGMISFVVEGNVEDGKRFASRTQVFALAESLGGVESLLEHPPSMTHASIPAELRRERGMDDGLIRLSVGVEDVEDLRQDLEQALEG